MLQIQKIELSNNQINIKVDELYQTDLNNIKEKERINLEEDNLMKRIETEPYFKKGLDIYKTLSKFYTCKYDGKKIVIEEGYRLFENQYSRANLLYMKLQMIKNTPIC